MADPKPHAAITATSNDKRLYHLFMHIRLLQ